MTPKRKILAGLTRTYLVELAVEAEVTGAARLKKDELVVSLSKKRSVKIENVLNGLSPAGARQTWWPDWLSGHNQLNSMDLH